MHDALVMLLKIVSPSDMCCEKLPSPNSLSEEKIEKLICSSAQRFDSLPPETQKLKDCFVACSSGDDDPVIVFISKMFPVGFKTKLSYFVV